MYRYIWSRRDLLHIHSRLDGVPHELELDKSLLRFRDNMSINKTECGRNDIRLF